ncbi:MAG: CocE/NonD family hydrolase [Verrucomicrobiota bacterium]
MPAAELKPLDLGGVTEKHLMIPMRDGTRLSAYVYFPKGDERLPALFQQRYADVSNNGTRLATAKLAAHGYIVANVSFRGAQQSEGTWVGYRALGWGELKDGYDICEWLAAQPWCNGKIGTFGGSQAGYAQNFLAVTRPPHLVAQYMTDTGLSLFHEGYRIGGASKPERFKRMDDVCRVPAHNRALLAEWLRHPTYDDYWAQENCALHFDQMNVPCFTIGSWYDFMVVGSIESFIGRQHRAGRNSRGQQQLLVGPWLHGGYPKSNKIGELVYPENAMFDVYAHMVRWFDHYLKGIDNGVERDGAVRYYAMGAVNEPGAPGNEWRTAKDWPVPAKATPYYFREGGLLTRQSPKIASSSTTYLADPLQPASLPYTSFPGARDARAFEKQPNVLTFTTEPLAQPVEWTGKVTAELYVSSTVKDTDFIVRVCDVYPDGRSILIMDMVRRARYRDGFEKEVLMAPDKIYKVSLYVGWLSQIFNQGHRIRVTVASTGAPFYEPNPNTGEPITLDFPTNAVVAKNTLYHDRKHASHVAAPVVK